QLDIRRQQQRLLQCRALGRNATENKPRLTAPGQDHHALHCRRGDAAESNDRTRKLGQGADDSLSYYRSDERWIDDQAVTVGECDRGITTAAMESVVIL